MGELPNGRILARSILGLVVAEMRLTKRLRPKRLRPERGAEPPSESAWGWGPTRSEKCQLVDSSRLAARGSG